MFNKLELIDKSFTPEEVMLLQSTNIKVYRKITAVIDDAENFYTLDVQRFMAGLMNQMWSDWFEKLEDCHDAKQVYFLDDHITVKEFCEQFDDFTKTNVYTIENHLMKALRQRLDETAKSEDPNDSPEEAYDYVDAYSEGYLEPEEFAKSAVNKA